MIFDWEYEGKVKLILIIVFTFIIVIGGVLLLWFLPVGRVKFSDFGLLSNVVEFRRVALPTHIETPEKLKAVYMTSWAMGNEKFRTHLFDLIDNTEINAVVIDVKDYTGRIAFEVENKEIADLGVVENRIPDIKDLIDRLHAKNVYVIGRISSFQDSYMIKVRPEWAVKTKTGDVWRDYKGIKWLDAGSKPVWDYLVSVGKEAYKVGFDELNFDYIRFPSDGDMDSISYTWSAGRNRQEIMREFFSYLNQSFSGLGPKISADLFGLTTTSYNDLGIGQILEDALHNFDYVAPMVYPSHFGKGTYGIAEPAKNPYDIIKISMSKAMERANTASTSPLKLRPWIQAFDLGAIYTPHMVRAQISATYDIGLDDWMMWNAASIYNKEFFVDHRSDLGTEVRPD
jgi:hypothetical protein